MRECIGCSCAAICLPLGKKKFYTRLYMCTICRGAIYCEHALVRLKVCYPVCWAWRTDDELYKTSTCQSCRDGRKKKVNDAAQRITMR